MSSGNTYPVKRVRFSGKRVPILLQDVNGPCPLIALANVLFLRGKVDLPAGAGEVDAVRGPKGSGRELSWSWVEKDVPMPHHVPAHAHRPLQDRVTQLLVGYFLDANPSEGRSEEVQVALHRQLEEAINLLPKLSTGIDVNVRFTTTDGFEVRTGREAGQRMGMAVVVGSQQSEAAQPISLQTLRDDLWSCHPHLLSSQFTSETGLFDLMHVRLVHGWLVDPQVWERSGSGGGGGVAPRLFSGGAREIV